MCERALNILEKSLGEEAEKVRRKIEEVKKAKEVKEVKGFS